MSKEHIFGFGLIALLTAALAGVIYKRLDAPKTDVSRVALAEQLRTKQADAALQKSTLVPIAEETEVPTLAPAAEWGPSKSLARLASHDQAEPRTTFMPAGAEAQRITSLDAAQIATKTAAAVQPQSDAAYEHAAEEHETAAHTERFDPNATAATADEPAALADAGNARRMQPAEDEPLEPAARPSFQQQPSQNAITDQYAQVAANQYDQEAGRPFAAAEQDGGYPQPRADLTAPPAAFKSSPSPSSPSQASQQHGYATEPEEYSAEARGYAAEPLEQTQPEATEPLPVRPADGRYKIQPGDNYWRISQKVYGTGAYFKAIQEHNRKGQGKALYLKVGSTLEVPDAKEMLRLYPDLSPKPRPQLAANPQRLSMVSTRGRQGGRVYVVEEGDRLFDIAKYELGKGERWGEIYDLNRDTLGDDFDYIRPGTQLVLPVDERPDAVARQPGEALQR